MAAKLITCQAVDASGNVLSGARLNVYRAGTTTPISLYQTPSLSGGVSATNPAIATSSGVVSVWFDDAIGNIKIVLTNSATTVTYFDQDNIPPLDRLVYPLGGFDQEVSTDSDVQFAGLTLGTSVSFSGIDADPDADRIVFWDDSDSRLEWLDLGTHFAISGNTLQVDGDLQDIFGLSPAQGAVIIGDGVDFVTESGATLRESLGLSIGSDVLAYDSNLDDFVSGFTLPSSDGASGQFLKTDGAGGLSFATPSGGGDVLAAGNETITGRYSFGGLGAATPGLSVSQAYDITPNAAGPYTLQGVDSNRAGFIGVGSSGARFGVSAGSGAAIAGYMDLNTDGDAFFSGINAGGQASYYSDLKGRSVSGLATGDWVEVAFRETAGDGGGGVFVWRAGDQSSNITADSQEGIWIAPDSDATGASGAWRRQYTGYANVRWFGAVGGSSNDDTAAVQGACDMCDAVVFDGIDCYINDVKLRNNPTEVKILPNSTVYQYAAVSGDSQLFEIITGGGGSRIHGGGELNGRRSALVGSYSAPDDWRGVHSQNGQQDVVIEGLTFKDFLGNAFVHLNGAFGKYSNLRIDGCTKAFIWQGCNYGLMENIKVDGVDSDGLAIFQHAMEIQGMIGATIRGIRFTNWNPAETGVGLDPFPRCWELYRLSNCTFDDIYIDGVTTSSAASTALDFDGVLDCIITNVHAYGYEIGLIANSCSNTVISNGIIDGEYKYISDSYGVLIRNSGIGVAAVTTDGARLDTRYNSGAIGIHLSNVRVRRTQRGFNFHSGIVTATNCHAEGVTDDGFSIIEGTPNGWYPGEETQAPRHVQLVGCSAHGCGQAGVYTKQYDDLTIVGCDFSNNGQDTSASSTRRSGIAILTAGGKTNALITGCTLEDNQEYTYAESVSFEPGSTDADDQFYVWLQRSDRICIGQYITIKNASGSGDITGKIVAQAGEYRGDNDQRILDRYVIEVSGGATFSATGNTSALTGTVTTDGSSNHILNGSGTAFESEVKGVAFVRVQGDTEWRRVIRVISDTVLWLADEFTTPASSDTLEILLCDLEGVPSQQYGLYADSDTTGKVRWSNTSAENNEVANVSINAASAYADGQLEDTGSGIDAYGDFEFQGDVAANGALTSTGDFDVNTNDFLVEAGDGRARFGSIASATSGMACAYAIDLTPNSSGTYTLQGIDGSRASFVGVGSSGARFGASSGSGAAITSYMQISPGGNLSFTRNGTSKLTLDGDTGTTGGTGSAGAGNQYVALTIGGVTYKLLHDGTV